MSEAWQPRPVVVPDEAPRAGRLPSRRPRDRWASPDVSPLNRALKLFASGAVGGVMSLAALGVLIIPNAVGCRGATRSLRIDRERQQRCMELGITPAELEALERAEAAREQQP